MIGDCKDFLPNIITTY